MWTTNPELASLLANPEDGYKYTQRSDKNIDWKCPKCNEVINKKIEYVEINGLGCPKCRMTFIVEDGEVKFKKKYKKGKFDKRNDFHIILKELRLKLESKNSKWSQEYVANEVGVTKTMYKAYEVGTEQPTLEKLVIIADLFEVTTDYLLGREACKNK